MAASTDRQDGTHSDHLRRGALGTAGIVFFVVAMVGPMGGSIGPSPFAFSNTGAGTVGAYLVAAIILLIFSVGFAAMGRHVPSAGGFAVSVSRGLGERFGFAAAGLAIVAYSGLLIGLFGSLGVFADNLFNDLFSIDFGPWIWAAITIAAVGIFGYQDVHVSARLLGAVMIIEVLVLVLLSLVVLGDGGAEGWTAKPFEPSTIFSGSVGITLLFACLSYVGFEATMIYGEEARNPQRTVPRATYIAVLLIGVFFVLVMYAVTVAYGPSSIQQAAETHQDQLVVKVGTDFIGSWYSTTMEVLLVTSVFAVVLGFHNTVARYLFSLGRSRMLPEWLARTHRRSHAPHRASVTLTAITAVVVALFWAIGADPYVELYSWLAGAGTLGVISLQAVASLAVIGFFRRNRHDASLWARLIAPLLGFAGLGMVVVLAVVNFDALVGSDTGVAKLLPLIVPLAALIGLLVGVIRQTSVGASLKSE